MVDKKYMGMTPATEQARGRPMPGQRFLPSWALSNTTAAAALFGAGAVAFFTTWFLMSPLVERVDRSFLMSMIIGNVVIAAGFAILIGVRLWHVLAERRHQLAGSRTHLQLVGLFSLLAVIPAIIAFLFAFTILRASLNDVFSERIDNYQNTAREFANAYWQDEANEAGINLNQIEFDLDQASAFGVTAQTAPIAFRRSLMEQALVRDLAAIVILDSNRNIIARVEMFQAPYVLPPASVFDQIDQAAEQGSPRKDWGNFDANNEQSFDYYRGILKINAYGGGYIVTYKEIPQAISNRLLAVRNLRDDWAEANASQARLEKVFLAGYIVLAVIILFGAIWLALWAATRFVQPIGRLVNMAERVSSGELGARVEVLKQDGELGALARSMNHMTSQLQTQRDDLIDTNRQFDERRRFTEAVLSGVSSGVVGLTGSGKITIANKSASELLGEAPAQLTGRHLLDLMPELTDLINLATVLTDKEVGDQIEVSRDGRTQTLNVRIVKDEVGGARRFVVTFDDITQLISAQRNAAWGDVARRIAHEIKNPLTPIQLSAERLRRKYANEITSTPEVFDRCTETIIRHVSDIGRMVDEFSSFARMPKPVIGEENLSELVKSAVFPQKVTFPDIDFDIITPSEESVVECDGRLIVQALSNLLKNAGESVTARASKPGRAFPGRIEVHIEHRGSAADISIIDNGLGLPPAERHRLTEPYMTTRVKGTGLGLAIVKKVAEEHGGALNYQDDDSLGPTGARMTITLPRVVVEHEPQLRPAAAE
ncbi:MAG: PAS domain-containing sensor histidine kinase [Pseudomonadota bacterium]